MRGKAGTHLRVGAHGCPGAGGTDPARPKRLLLAQCPLGGMGDHGSQRCDAGPKTRATQDFFFPPLSARVCAQHTVYI